MKTKKQPNQSEKFIKKAKELGCDEDEKAFDRKLKNLTKNKKRGKTYD